MFTFSIHNLGLHFHIYVNSKDLFRLSQDISNKRCMIYLDGLYIYCTVVTSNIFYFSKWNAFSFFVVVVFALHNISMRRHSFFTKCQFHIPDIINFIITYTENQYLWKWAQIARFEYGRTAVDWVSFQTHFLWIITSRKFYTRLSHINFI